MNIVLGILFLIMVICVWRYHQLKMNCGFLKTIPEDVDSLPFLGLALKLRSTKDLLNILMKSMRTYGGLVRGKIGPFRQFVLVSDYRILEFIFTSTSMLKKSVDYNFLRPWLGTGLLTSHGLKWKKHRRILTPAFHFQILEQFIETFESCGDILLQKLGDNLGKKSFDVYPHMTLCSLDIICESIMGISINAQSGENVNYVQSVKDMCRIMVERSLSPIQMYDFLFPFTKNYYTQKRALKILHQQSNDVITARRRDLESGPKQNGDTKNDYFRNKKAFLDLLLQTRIDGRTLTHEEIREEVDTFMFEGHDTTASALSFTLFCLANHPDVQEKAFKEQQRLFQAAPDQAITYQVLQEMKYLELVIKESLRLYPSVPLYNREVGEGAKIGTELFQYHFMSSTRFISGDKILSTGTTFTIFAFGIHRNPKYFKEPEQFLPERFENVDGRLPYAYVPFSAGPRNCIGQKFAMLQMKSILSKVLRKYQLLPAEPRHELQLIAEMTLKSANGINIRLKIRK